MKTNFRYFLVFVILFLVCGTVAAQVSYGAHKVKRKETIFSIARKYNLAVQDIIKHNPVMNTPGFELKKGDVVRIPLAKKSEKDEANANGQAEEKKVDDNKKETKDFSKLPIRLGVMLPLHNKSGEGLRMLEYYRGVLMACDSVKKLGISVDVHAWNTPEDCDITQVLKEKNASKCDMIIGPFYTKQVGALSNFVNKHDIRLVIPFSIYAPQLSSNSNMFQIWQPNMEFNEMTITRFLSHFKDYHPIFVDCNDTTSRKGIFTFGLRRHLEQRGIEYAVTNVTSSEEYFSKAFSRTKPNIIIPNTGRLQELGVVFSKVNGLKINEPDLNISMFGYTEWLTYTRVHLENFYKFNTFIPSPFFYNPLSAPTQRLEQKYRWNFHTDMHNNQPRLAITGFDQAYFFLRGLYKYGKSFNGAAGMLGYTPVQTPLQFERYGNGGFRNRTILFVHYLPDHKTEYLKFH